MKIANRRCPRNSILDRDEIMCGRGDKDNSLRRARAWGSRMGEFCLKPSMLVRGLVPYLSA